LGMYVSARVKILRAGDQGFSLMSFTGLPANVSPQPLASALRKMVGADFSKALSPILRASPRKVTADSLVHREKTHAPMLVTPSGIVILVRLVQ